MFGLADNAGPPAWLIVIVLVVCAAIVLTMVHLQHKAELEAMEKSIKDSSKITPNFEEEVSHALNETAGREGDTRQ